MYKNIIESDSLNSFYNYCLLSVRPTDLASMLESLESNVPYHDQYIDNPFSSPSPLTSPNDERLDPFASRRTDKIYLQGGGTFRAVSRDRIMQSQQSKDEEKYLRLVLIVIMSINLFYDIYMISTFY